MYPGTALYEADNDFMDDGRDAPNRMSTVKENGAVLEG